VVVVVLFHAINLNWVTSFLLLCIHARYSLFLSWACNVLLSAVAATDGKPSISLITLRHTHEIARQSAVQWGMYKPFEHRMKGMVTKEVRYDGSPCFGGCAPLEADNPAFQLTGRAAELAGRHPPGSLSLVLPWCCEWVSFILQQIDFKGLLKEIYLYDKCSHTVRCIHSKLKDKHYHEVHFQELVFSFVMNA